MKSVYNFTYILCEAKKKTKQTINQHIANSTVSRSRSTAEAEY